MYIVTPITMETLWGDDRLHEYQGDPSSDTIGCVYTISGIDSINCNIHNHNEHTTLKEAVMKDPEAFGLREGEEYPLIIAFDSCAQDVSFQIHPTDDYAKEKLHLPYGKSEAWYFIEQPAHSWVYAENIKGCKEAVETALETKNFQDVMGQVPVKNEDLVYIRSGIMHALTKGSLIYEIQQSTNITYRLYDYERKDKSGHTRPIHTKEALENLDSSLKVEKRSFSIGSEFTQREFSLQHVCLSDSYTNTSSLAAAVSVISGELKAEGIRVPMGGSILVLPGETITIEGNAECMIAVPHAYWRS